MTRNFGNPSHRLRSRWRTPAGDRPRGTVTLPLARGIPTRIWSQYDRRHALAGPAAQPEQPAASPAQPRPGGATLTARDRATSSRLAATRDYSESLVSSGRRICHGAYLETRSRDRPRPPAAPGPASPLRPLGHRRPGNGIMTMGYSRFESCSGFGAIDAAAPCPLSVRTSVRACIRPSVHARAYVGARRRPRSGDLECALLHAESRISSAG